MMEEAVSEIEELIDIADDIAEIDEDYAASRKRLAVYVESLT